MVRRLNVSNPGKLVLLTGAFGFIGIRLQRVLIERGYRLRVFTRRAEGAASSADCMVGDLTDASACRKAMEGVNIVIHAAGEKKDPSRFWPVNMNGTKNLLEAALDKGVERFVHLSSVGVIGANPLNARTYDEGVPCMPRNAYEQSKWEAEKLVQQAARNGLPAAILRPSNVFGDDDPERGLLKLIQSVKKGWFVYMGGRDVVCNYVFVDDVAHACLCLAEHPSAVSHTYHLSDDCTLGEFIDVLADELRVKRPRIRLPYSLSILMRTALQMIRPLTGFSKSSIGIRLMSLNNQARFATTRLADELDLDYPVGWRAGLGRVVEWYRSQGMV